MIFLPARARARLMFWSFYALLSLCKSPTKEKNHRAEPPQ